MGLRLLAQLVKEKQMKQKGGLYHRTQVKLAFNSNRIEGSRLSEEQTRYIYETDTVSVAPGETADVNDIIETVNHFACFDFILSHADESLTEELIKEIHRLLKRGSSDERQEWFRVGDYKLRPNIVGDSKTTPPSKVGVEMKRLLDSYNQIERADAFDIIDLHYRFERVHPFQDGNGRVGRLIMFKECLKNNVVPFIIDHEHKLYYYRGLSEYKAEKGFLRDTCLSAQDRYRAEISYFLPDIGL